MGLGVECRVLARVRIPRQTKKYSASTQGSLKLWFPLNATVCQTCLYHTIGNPAYGNRHASSQATRSVNKHGEGWAVVVDQLVEQSLPTPEIRGSNPVIGKILSTQLSTNCIIEKTKIKKRMPGMAHPKKHVEGSGKDLIQGLLRA